MEANLIDTARGLGLPADIERAAGLDGAFAFRYAKRLTEEHGVSRANADWAVSVWCVCYGERILGKSCDVRLQTGKNMDAPDVRGKTGPGGRYGDQFTYAGVDGGYGIRSFTGADRRTLILPAQHNGLPVREVLPGAFSGTEVEEAVMTDSVQRIGDGAFRGCRRLRQVILSQTLEEIGASAFEGCAQLTALSLPPTLRAVGSFAFRGTGLRSPLLTRGLCFLGDGAFQDCGQLTKLRLPDGLNAVPRGLLMGCVSLTEATLPDGAESIGENAFRGCASLESLTAPNGIKTIGENAFSGTAPRFTLLVDRSSAAERYARAHNIRFQIMG